MSNDRQTAARETAKALIEVQAVLVNVDKPFITTAGWASPVYIDMRKIIAFPRLRRRLVEFATRTIERDIGYESLDVVAGGETAGIPFAAWIADSLMLPMQYVRKKPKGFGRNARIEGDVMEGGRALLVEDLATDGGSKKDFVQALRELRAALRSRLRVLLLRYIRRRARGAGRARHKPACARNLARRARRGPRAQIFPR